MSPGPWQSPGPERPGGGGGPCRVSLDGAGRAAHGHLQTIRQTQRLPQWTSILSQPGGRKPEMDGPVGPVPGGAAGTLPQASLPACRPPVEPGQQKDSSTPCLCCHRPSFPKPVSCSLSCEDPCHTGLPRGNHLNGTFATTLFQMGYQLGFWDMGPQHELPTIPPTQAPPPGTAGVGPRSWASWSQGRGAAVGRGAGDTSLRPGNQD